MIRIARLWTASKCDSEVGVAPNHAELAYSTFDLIDDGLVDHCSLSGKQVWGNSTKKKGALSC